MKRFFWLPSLSELKFSFNLFLVETRSQSAGSSLGFLTLFLQPLVFFIVYVILYIIILKINPSGESPSTYAGKMVLTLAGCLSVISSLTLATTAVRSNSSLLSGTLVPIKPIIMKPIFAGYPQILTALAVITVLSFSGSLNINYLALIFVLITHFMLQLSIIFIFTPLGVIFKDLSFVITSFTYPMLTFSPIAYDPSSFSGPFRLVLSMNPFSMIVYLFRMPFEAGLRPGLSILVLLIAMVLLRWSHSFFLRLESFIVTDA